MSISLVYLVAAFDARRISREPDHSLKLKRALAPNLASSKFEAMETEAGEITHKP